MIKGIDISKHQGVIDWDSVKDDGIEFAILRCGYGDNISSQDDVTFETNYNECKRVGIPVGTYIYSYADSIAHAKSEAEHTLRLIEGKELEYGIWYDLEDKVTGKCPNDVIADIAQTFCDIIENAGYKVGIYANKNWFNTKLTSDIFDNYDKWVASYGKNDGGVPSDAYKYQGEHKIWQYTSSGTVSGISGRVDMNICYDETIQPEQPEQPENTDEKYSAGSYEVTANALNVRKEPNTSSAIVGKINRGSKQGIDYTQGNWGHLMNNAGWICLDYCKEIDVENEEKYSAGSYEVIANVLNVRQAPNTSSKIVAKLTKGSKQGIDYTEGDWGHILNDAGWIHLGYCKLI